MRSNEQVWEDDSGITVEFLAGTVAHPFFQNWLETRGDGNYGKDLDAAIAKDAQLVARALASVEEIKRWACLPFAKQRLQVPDIDTSSYSGFAFRQMIELAIAYLQWETDKSSLEKDYL